MVMRMSLDQINTLGRVTQGVRLIKLKDEQTVATISIVDKEKEEPEVPVEDVEFDNESIEENNNEVINNVSEDDLGNNVETDDLNYEEESVQQEEPDDEI